MAALHHMNPACCGGSFDQGTPKGEMADFNGCQVYVSTPATVKLPDCAVVVAPDVFSTKLINNKLICDKFADSLGCLVILADYFAGNGMDPYIMDIFGRKNSELSWFGWAWKYTEMFAWIGFRGLPWFVTHGHAKAIPVFVNALKYLRNEKKIKKIASVGYCYGGGVLSAVGSSTDADLCDSYNIIHPGGFKIDQVTNFKKPLYWVFSEKDMSCKEEMRHQIEDIVKRMPVRNKSKYYPGVDHGFAIRGDAREPKVMEARQDCFHESVGWFKETFQ